MLTILLILIPIATALLVPVSYTHLDVYKRQDMDVLHKLTASHNVDFAGRMVYNEAGEEVFNFGKHNGKKVMDVLAKEPAFFDWILKNDFPLDTKRKLTEIKLRALTQR